MCKPDDNDDLSVARGIITGLVMCIVLWAVIGLIVYVA